MAASHSGVREVLRQVMGLLYIPAALLFANLGLYAYGLNEDDELASTQRKITALHGEINLALANIRLHEEYNAKRPQIERTASVSIYSTDQALRSIGPSAKALGIFSVSFKMGEFEERWRGENYLIDEASLELWIESLTELQAFDLVDSLQSQWGGEFTIRRVEAERRESGESENSVISNKITLDWIRLKPVNSA